MPMITRQHDAFQEGAQSTHMMPYVTLGMVVDTNDPQQMGRVRVVCAQWGDTWQTPVEDLPWAVYMSPYGGQIQVGTRGPGIQDTEGGVAYGMWAIPKVNSQVAVICLDGNPMTRMYIGSVYDQFTPHTMPHGRFMYDDHPELEKAGSDPKPYGPYSSSEKFIQPLADNMKQAFGGKGDTNHEFRTRGADFTATRLDVSQLASTYSNVQDDKDITVDGWTNTQGYQVSRTDPNAPSSHTDRNYDSMVVALTSPGFHALSMDDRQENCRIRIRTTAGHQIIMDDTNERMYIATAKGNNWIELDQNGNIDVFSGNKVNIHSVKEMNFTSDDTIRMYAAKGIHMHSDDEIRFDAAKDISVKTAQNLRSHASQSQFLQSDQDTNVKAGGSVYVQGDSDVSVKAGGALFLQSGGNLNAKAGGSAFFDGSSAVNVKSGGTVNISGTGEVGVLAGGALILTGAPLQLNGPTPPGAAASASPATAATAASEQPAFFTDRVPDHEPWARVMTKDDTTHAPEFSYDDPSVNKSERGLTTPRGSFWRR